MISTKLNLIAGYNRITIKKGKEWKTAFCSRHSHYENTVVPFGLADAFTTFQNMMNAIFKVVIDHGVVIYLDNILIYCSSEEDHIALTKKVLECLQEYQLALSPEKFKCHMSKFNLLSYIISENDIEMDQEKIWTVLE